MIQKIPREYRDKVQKLIENWELEGKGKSEAERQFLFFLQQEDFRKPFMVFMEKEFSHENLDFWQRVDKFKRRYNSTLEVRAPELLKEATDIYTRFIVEKSEHSINIPNKDGACLRKIFSDNFSYPQGINQWVFDSAYESILKLMYSDTFSRYRLTEEGSANFSKAVKMWDALPVNKIRKFGEK